MNKDELVSTGAKLLKELLIASGVKWDEAFYRYVEFRDEGSFRSQWSCRKGRFLKIYPVDPKLAIQYLANLDKTIREICRIIESEGNERPVVVVLRVDAAGRYTMKFERQNVKAMQIDSLHIGKAESLFGEGEVELDT